MDPHAASVYGRRGAALVRAAAVRPGLRERGPAAVAPSVISNPAAMVHSAALGEHFEFTDSVEADYGLPPRSFTSFKQAAAEAAISRLYGGIHYRAAVEAGASEGERVGAFVVAHVH